ncbi:MAG: hypothetical protein ORN83_08850 [Chthoniobacteraceae bacterium]|nr:hypothetical protein [Chthoniobacteraceae bacterium]
MSNTIAGVNLAQIAQESLPALQVLFAPLSGISTDFSSDIADRGASVTTRYPVNVTAQDLSAGFDSTNVETVASTITLNQYPGFVYGFSDLERSKSSINLNDLFIQPAMQAVGTSMFGSLWNLVTAANFDATPLTSTAANFDRNDLADLRAQLNVQGAPQQGRAVVLSPAYFASLLKSLNTAEFPGFIREKGEGFIPRVAGFDVYESTLADANGEYLQGFAFHKSALLMAARSVNADGAVQTGTEIADVVIPQLNLPIQFRRAYDNRLGQLWYSFGVLFGIQKGRPQMGVRIVSQ